jgi:hypothetical protein
MQDLLLSNLHFNTIGMEGPTGCGKTQGILSVIQSHQKIFGRTLMIFPNQHSISRLKRNLLKNNLSIYNAKYGLEYFIKNLETIKTIVIDEAHYVSRDYETLLRTLKNLRHDKRIILISATLDKEKLKNYFPSIEFFSIKKKTKYPINIKYVNVSSILENSDPQFQLYPETTNWVLQNIPLMYPIFHKRIIMFLSSHDHCEKYKKQFKLKGITNCLVLYGNLNDEEFANTERIIYDPRTNFILFCTNIVETAVTIPNVSLVVDLCVSYKYDGNMLVLDWCDQSSLIQRAGRTGRTCPGDVIRLCSEANYNLLPFHRQPNYAWEKPCLQLKMFIMNPFEILGDDVKGAMDGLKDKQILNKNYDIGDLKFANFCMKCPLEINCSTLLWKLFKNPGDKTTDILITLAITLINLLETQNVTFIYHKDSKNSFSNLTKLERNFKEKDELCILMSIFISLFLCPKPVYFSSNFNLNFKTFRIWYYQFENCLSMIYPDLNWKCIKDCLFQYNSVHQFKNLFLTDTIAIYSLEGFRSKISKFLYHNTNYKIETSNQFGSSNEIINFDMKMIKIDKHVYEYSSFLILCQKRVSFLPNALISLYVLPYHIEFDFAKLQVGIASYQVYKTYKLVYKEQYNIVLYEINNEVSYRPNFYKMLQVIKTWQESIDQYNLRFLL